MRYISLHDWFISFNIMVSKCIYFNTNDSHLSFCIAQQCFNVDYIFFIHSSLDGNTGHFQNSVKNGHAWVCIYQCNISVIHLTLS